ncbi:hypothetical protein MMC07_002172 [Pseudocyphellaria aurata]|nr:hypothetical protein [Pseudocyphellaria aurata]
MPTVKTVSDKSKSTRQNLPNGTIGNPKAFLLVLKGILVMFLQGTDLKKIIDVYRARGIALNPYFVTALGDFSGISLDLHISVVVEKRMNLFNFMVAMDSVGIGASKMREAIRDMNFKEDDTFVKDFLTLGKRFTTGVRPGCAEWFTT